MKPVAKAWDGKSWQPVPGKTANSVPSFDKAARPASKAFHSLKSAYLEIWDVLRLRRPNPLAIPNKDDLLVRPHAHSPLARPFVEQLRRIYLWDCQAVLTGLVLTKSRVDPSLPKTCHWSVHPSGDLRRHKSWPTRRPFGTARRYRSRVIVPTLVAQANRDIGPSNSETPKNVTKKNNSADSKNETSHVKRTSYRPFGAPIRQLSKNVTFKFDLISACVCVVFSVRLVSTGTLR